MIFINHLKQSFLKKKIEEGDFIYEKSFDAYNHPLDLDLISIEHHYTNNEIIFSLLLVSMYMHCFFYGAPLMYNDKGDKSQLSIQIDKSGRQLCNPKHINA